MWNYDFMRSSDCRKAVFELQGAEVQVRGSFSIISAELDFIPLHIQGGYILPTQQPANSTVWR